MASPSPGRTHCRAWRVRHAGFESARRDFEGLWAARGRLAQASACDVRRADVRRADVPTCRRVRARLCAHAYGLTECVFVCGRVAPFRRMFVSVGRVSRREPATRDARRRWRRPNTDLARARARTCAPQRLERQSEASENVFHHAARRQRSHQCSRQRGSVQKADRHAQSERFFVFG